MTPHYLRMVPGDPLPDLADYAPFSAVVILSSEYPTDWRTEVNRWLLKNGCRYVMAWGPDCEAWHDNVDGVNLECHPFGDIPDDRFVMTTWHDNDTLEKLLWYGQFCGNLSYDGVELNDTILLDVGSVDRRSEMLTLWEQSQSLHDREED